MTKKKVSYKSIRRPQSFDFGLAELAEETPFPDDTQLLPLIDIAQAKKHRRSKILSCTAQLQMLWKDRVQLACAGCNMPVNQWRASKPH